MQWSGLIGVLGAVLLAAPAAAQDTAAAHGVVEAFHAALAASDTNAALALLAPDAVIYESGRAETRAEYASHHLAADMGYAAATTRTVTNRTQRALGEGEVALVLSQIHTTGTFRDRPVDRESVETAVVRRTRDGWRILHLHWSARR